MKQGLRCGALKAEFPGFRCRSVSDRFDGWTAYENQKCLKDIK